MNNDYTLEFALASNEPDRLREATAAHGGTFYLDGREKWQHLPFRALATFVTDEPQLLAELADAGLYVVCRRLIKAGDPGAIGLFPMVRHADLTHAESDAHWRDKHAPLALVHHCHMTHYTQLSVVNTLAGPEFDGFALCGFANEDDVRNRFFTSEESVKIIHDDVKTFANPKASPPRLIVTETRFG